MKSFMKTLCVALLAAGLLLPACEKPAEAPAEKVEEAVQELNKAEEKVDEAKEEVAEKEEAVEEVLEVNEDNYIKAAFEVTCVNAHIDDPARARELKDEIYPRYGFDEASFSAAQKTLAEKDTVKTAIDARMERCNKEFAEKLGEAQAEPAAEEKAQEVDAGAEGGKEAEKKPAKPVPAKVGMVKDTAIGGGGFSNTSLNLNVRKDFTVSGEIRGEREGANFLIPFKGKVSEKGDITATGERGGNSVNVTGRLTSNGAAGSLSGTVHQKNFKTTFNAK